MDFLNQLKQDYRFLIHFHVYKKEITHDLHEQVIYAIFFEEVCAYISEYPDGSYNEFDFERDEDKFYLRCMLFADGGSIDPLEIDSSNKEDSNIHIHELNVGKYDNFGAGSFVLESFENELRQYNHIKTISGMLSSFDYPQRDQLIHFYSKNGFDEIIPMTDDINGKMVKYL